MKKYFPFLILAPLLSSLSSLEAMDIEEAELSQQKKKQLRPYPTQTILSLRNSVRQPQDEKQIKKHLEKLTKKFNSMLTENTINNSVNELNAFGDIEKQKAALAKRRKELEKSIKKLEEKLKVL